MDAFSPDRWKRIDRLFEAALDQPPDRRDAFLRQACGEDLELFDAVCALLADAEVAGRRLGESVTDFAAALLPGLAAELARPPDEGPARVGPYRILDELGRGGMGVVYLAERADVPYRQPVALKLVRRGMDSEEILRRFRYERLLLARLQHPNIARLLDGGQAEDGRPYLVMEYVEGEPIDVYCDRRRLSVEERLRLFMQVGMAVQAAHRNLVVHRDLKPSNILVTEDPGSGPAQATVKLLDFGIARLLTDEATPEEPVTVPHTRTGMRVLTPAYASPEQLRGEAVTTAADVYALGVVLYELLTGHRPYTSGDGLTLEQAILTQMPARPSTRVEEGPADGGSPEASRTREAICAARRTTPERLRRRLQGDLDTMLLMALRKEPERRYASAEAFVDDIRRHLAGLPVRAQRDTWRYRARKFARRHTAGLAVAGLALLLLAGLTAFYTARLTQERDRARLEAQKARAALAFMEDLFDGVDPDATAGDTLDAFDLLARGARRLEQPGALPPAEAAQTAHTLGALYLKLGDYDAAERWLTAALDGWRRLPRAEAEAEAATLVSLGHLATHRGQYARADSLFAAALALPAAAPGDRAGRLVDYGQALTERQDYRRADSVLHRALALLPGTDPAGAERRADAWFALGTIAMNEADYARAESLFARVLAWREAHLGRMHNRTLDVLNNLGNLYADAYRYEEADSLLSEVLRLRTALLGPEHPLTGEALNNLGLVAFGLGDYDRADSLLRRSLALAEQHAGPVHRDVGMTMNNLGWVALRRDRPQDAEALFRRALAIMEAASGPVSADAALLLGNVGFVLHQQDRPADALPFFQRAVDVRRQVHGDSSMHVAWRLFALGEALRDLGRLDEAEAAHRESVALRRALRPAGHFDVGRGLNGLGRTLVEQGRYAEAEPVLREAVAIMDALAHPNRAISQLWLGTCLTGLGRFDEAEALLRSAQAARPDDPLVRRALDALHEARQRAAPAAPPPHG
ncbi:serine/threonine protein kinase [Rhodothermaceae bacterium RA]|nr:serine/threonine protein kinase [Rhodothermaceae bacterium RA]